MKEIKAIIEAYDEIDRSTIKAALATVVRVEGSSYRRTGARMLVLDNGTWVGGISGGCLEGDALKRARFAINKAEATLITYDTTQDDEHQIGVGLGCNGIIDVLFTPLHFQDPNNPVEILKSCLQERRKTHVLLTFTAISDIETSLKTGNVITYDNPADLKGFFLETIENQLLEHINIQLVRHKSAPIRIESAGKLEVFIEILPPEIHLIMMGNQYDVFPLTKLVKEMGWRASVVANPTKVNQKIRAIADEIVSPENFQSIHFDAHTAIILMSHDYKTDKQNLPIALKTASPYVGMLGPKVRSERIIRELSEENHQFSEAELARIFAPVGLDIGAVSPEEIALSLIAEIRAVFSNRKGGYLRLRQDTIHERI